MTDAPQQLSPEDAQRLLGQAQQTGDAAIAGVGWRHVTSLVTLGAATSLGTLAMNLTTGVAYLTIMIAMIVWVLVIVVGISVAGAKTSTFGFGKRWGRYMAAWAAAYVVALVCATTAVKGNLLVACLASALIAAVTLFGAVREVRR